jgi:hypothetical protein
VAPLAFDAGPGTFAVATGNFTGNGILDLVTANQQGNNVSLLLGNGDGTFQKSGTFPVGKGPQSLTVGDFRGDGLLDVAVANRLSNTVSVLLGNGNGTFKPAHDYSVGSFPESIVVAGLTGSGHLDLVTANGDNGNVSVLLGNGDGTFQTAKNYAAGKTGKSVAVGDFTGSGIPDLAVADLGSDQVSILLGNGDGTFQAPASFAAGPQPFSVRAADLTGDGVLDLAVADYGDLSTGDAQLRIFKGNGDGSFKPGAILAAGTYAVDAAVGDFNGDGQIDVGVSTEQGFHVFLGNGDGTFQSAGTFAAGGDGKVTLGEFTGNGILDLAAANSGDDKVSVLLGNGDGTFEKAPTFAAGTAPASVAVGDFIGNGVDDLAVADYGDLFGNGQGVSILLGNGDGTFQSPLALKAGTRPDAVVVGDFNGDGKLDLAVADFGDFCCDNGDVTVFLGNGDGTFKLAGTFSAGAHPYAMAAGDFDTDGNLDLAVVDHTNPFACTVLLGNGDGTFRTGGTLGVESPSAIAVADFNGDGNPDVAVTDLYGLVAVQLGNGDGTFQGPHYYGVGTIPVSVTVGDFNGDGNLDLAVANGSSRNVSILLGKGDGTFGTAKNFSAGEGQVVMAAEFNQNGRLDLAVASEGVRVLPGNGDGTFQTEAISYVGHSGILAAAIGEFNGDGWPDVVLANADSNDVSIFLNDQNGTLTTRPHSSQPTAPANADQQPISAHQPVALNPTLQSSQQDLRSSPKENEIKCVITEVSVVSAEVDSPPVTTAKLEPPRRRHGPAGDVKLDAHGVLVWLPDTTLLT